MAVQITSDQQQRLQHLAAASSSTPNELAQQAVEDFLISHEELFAAVQEADEEFQRDEFLPLRKSSRSSKSASPKYEGQLVAARNCRSRWHRLLHRADDPVSAENVATKIFEQVMSLSSMEQRGKIGRVPGTREMLVLPWPYFVVYRVLQDGVRVMRIRHTAQRWTVRS